MFYKIGFYVLSILLIGMMWIFQVANPMKNAGAASWIDLYSDEPEATVRFLSENLNIKVASTSESAVGGGYTVIKANGQIWPFAGVMKTPAGVGAGAKKVAPHATIYITVKDYAETAKRIMAAGAKPVLENKEAGGMKFGIYIIPGGLDIGIAQY
jgi:predicted enzyme related to lactoylglutathione lyase